MMAHTTCTRRAVAAVYRTTNNFSSGFHQRAGRSPSTIDVVLLANIFRVASLKQDLCGSEHSPPLSTRCIVLHHFIARPKGVLCHFILLQRKSKTREKRPTGATNLQRIRSISNVCGISTLPSRMLSNGFALRCIVIIDDRVILRKCSPTSSEDESNLRPEAYLHSASTLPAPHACSVDHWSSQAALHRCLHHTGGNVSNHLPFSALIRSLPGELHLLITSMPSALSQV